MSDSGPNSKQRDAETSDASSDQAAIDPADVCRRLIESTYSLQLATLGGDGVPHCGYTPFITGRGDDGKTMCLYIFVSELAVHTRDLLANHQVSAMIIEDEQTASQVFARTRVTYECDVVTLARDHADWSHHLDAYRQRHGKVVDLLRELPDFHLMRLQPRQGNFVMGFGRAYRLSGARLDTFEHIRRA